MRKTYTELTAIFLVLCTISVGHSQDEGKQEVGKKEKARKDLTMQWVTAADGTANVAEWAAYADNRFVYLADYAAAAKDAVETDKAMLGVHVREADATLRQHLDINGGFGLVVEHVTEKSAAEESKLQVHDVLYKIDGQMLANLDQFQTLIDSHKPGDEIEVEYFRGGKLLDVKSKLSQKRVASVGLHHLEQYHKDLFQVAKDPHGNKINYQIHNCEACHATPARWGKPQGIALDRWINASGDNRLIGWNVDSFAKDVDKTDKADK